MIHQTTQAKRQKIKAGLEKGENLSTIAKQIGLYYTHVRQIIDQDTELRVLYCATRPKKDDRSSPPISGQTCPPAAPKDVEHRKANGLLEAYLEATSDLEEIYSLLELAQRRCINVHHIRKAGNCRFSDRGPPISGSRQSTANFDDDEDCFGARLRTADARVATKRLLAKMKRSLETIEK